MQMANATPQGIAGLMQKPPGQPMGQPPMPSPNKASPMAGLGSVDDRVSAYMGDSKPLEQRYAMSQDLLDLLALQKIKSQKDAAARQMQLQMAQQQAQNGEAGMTVAQQREKEVTDMTKNELAQQRGDTAEQQTIKQQEMAQKMMGGVAGAPGAAIAAQPQAMAAGGIVGYAGLEGSKVEDPRRKRREGESFEAFRQRIIALDEQDAQARKQKERDINEADRLAELKKRGGAAVPPNPLLQPRVDPGASRPRVQLDSKTDPRSLLFVPPANAAPAPAPRIQLDARTDPRSTLATPAAVAPPAAPPAGLPSLPGAGPAAAPAAPPAPTAPAQSDFNKKVQEAELAGIAIDPEKKGLAEEERVEKRMALSPDQRNVYNEGIAGLQQMYGEQYDPERQRQEGLKRFLIGAGGRRYGEFGGGAASAMDYDAAQRTAKLKEFGDIQGKRTGLIDIDRANVKGGIDAGAGVAKLASEMKARAMTAAGSSADAEQRAKTDVYQTDVLSRDKALQLTSEDKNKALDRGIERLKAQVTSDATAAQREQLSHDRARAVYGAQISKVQELERRMDDDFSKQYGMLLMQEQSGKMEPIQKNQLDTARLLHQQQKAKIRREMEPVLEDARQKLGVSGLSSGDKALVDKYSKGK